MAAKTRIFSIRLTEEERLSFARAAKQKHIPLSTWIRVAAWNQADRQPDQERDPLSEVRRLKQETDQQQNPQPKEN